MCHTRTTNNATQAASCFGWVMGQLEDGDSEDHLHQRPPLRCLYQSNRVVQANQNHEKLPLDPTSTVLVVAVGASRIREGGAAELMHHVTYHTRHQGRQGLFPYVEWFCNRRHLHSTIGYQRFVH